MIEAAAMSTQPSVSEADRERYKAERAKYKVQLTTETGAGPYEGMFVVTDPEQLRFQPYGRIEKLGKEEEEEEDRPPTPPPVAAGDEAGGPPKKVGPVTQ